MAEDKVEINTKINTKPIENGLNKLAEKIKSFGNSGTLKALSNIGATVTGIGAAVSGVTKVVQAAAATIADLTDSYRVQAQAETQLAQAAKNNPYLLSENVTALKNYAAEVQSYTTYGDEQLMPLMAQLAAAGRTQDEIMQIVSASVDIAASGMMSLDSAVDALNKTYSGNVGLLGNQIGELKGLTEEELKHGEAVKIISQKYDGMAAEVAKVTGTSQQLKNAFGDLKEELGAPFEKALSPIRSFFTEIVGGWASALSAKRKYNESMDNIEGGKATAADYTARLEVLTKDIEKARAELAAVNKTIADGAGYALENAENLARAKTRLEALNAEYVSYMRMKDKVIQKEKEEAEAAEKAKKEAEEAAAAQAAVDARDKLRAQYDETIRQKQEEINQRRINGEEISKEAEAQEMYNTAFSAYVKMMSDPAMKGNKGTFKHEVDARAQIADWGTVAGGEELKKQIAEFTEELGKAADEANGIVKKHYQEVLDALDEEFNAIIESKYIENEKKLELDEEYKQKRAEIVAAMVEEERQLVLSKVSETTELEKSRWGEYEDGLRTLLETRKAIDSSEVLSAEEKEAAIDAVEKKHAEEKKNLLKDLAEENRSWWDEYREQQEELLRLKEEVDASEIASEEEKAEAIEAINRRLTESKANQYAETMTQISSYTSQIVSIVNDAANLMLETSRNNAQAEMAALEEKYRNGEMSEEEYEAKVTEIKKKAAQEQYKIQMAQWSMSLLEATVNIAQGVTKAIAQGGFPAGIISGALVAAAGGVQIASIIANKPTPPSFSTGGIVGGSSYSGDNVAANLNSREMVMNMNQQKGLWDFINGGSNGQGGGVNIEVNNSAANIATAQPKLTKDKIEILIDARVNDSMKKGRYDQSLNVANEGMGGDYYGI